MDNKIDNKIIALILLTAAIIISIILIISYINSMEQKEETSDTKAPTEEYIKSKLLELPKKADTYKVNIDADITKTVFFATVTANAHASGETDNKKRRMRMDMNITIPFKGKENAKIYIIGNNSYTKQSGEWIKKELTTKERDNFWNNQEFIKREIDLINASTIKSVSDGTADGSDAWVVKITPDNDTFKSYISAWMEQFMSVGFSKTQNSDYISNIEFKNVTQEYTITRNDYLIIKGYTRADVVFSNESYGVKISTKIYDYNEPVDIILPEDAKTI